MKFLRFLRTLKPEFALLLLALVAFPLVVIPLRLMDPTAGVLDAGILHFAVAGAVILFLGVVAVWFLINLTFRPLDRYFDGDDDPDADPEDPPTPSLWSDFQSSPPVVRLVFFLLTFLGLLFAFVLAATGLSS